MEKFDGLGNAFICFLAEREMRRLKPLSRLCIAPCPEDHRLHCLFNQNKNQLKNNRLWFYGVL